MLIVRLLLLILLSPLLLLGSLLGFRRNDMAYLPEGHPEMKAAFAMARATLEEFRAAMAAPAKDWGNFAIKARFPVEGGSEHIWVDTLEAKGSGFIGKLANHPQGLHGLKLGSTVDVSEDMISDWAYSKSGVYEGHFTTKVLLPRFSKSMRRKVEEIYGWKNRA